MVDRDRDGLAIQAQTLMQTVRALAVVDEATFLHAGEQLRAVKLYERRVHEVFDPIVEAAHTAHKVAVDQRKALLQPAEEAEALLKRGMGDYQIEQERLRREAEAAAEKERLRLEALARQQEAEATARLQREAEDRVLNEAVAAEAQGDTAAAQRLLDAPLVVEMPAPRPVFVPPASVAIPAPPKAQGVSFREAWDYEITNPAAIPREYLMPDETKIRRVVNAMRGVVAIPGIRVVPKRTVVVTRWSMEG